jgi:glucose 1-dehydrogenase
MNGERKTVLITGASRGIGKGIAIAMAEHGYDLAISHLNDHDNAEEVALIVKEQYGRRCAVFDVDLEEETTPEKLVRDVIKALGHINVLVNNAGVTVFSHITTMEIEKINKLTNLDFRAPLLMMRSAGKHMIERKIKGSIINITSTRSERAYPGDAVYGGVKAALKRATETIALEFSTYDIRVNCIAPGAIQTSDERENYYKEFGKKIPLNRAGTPKDIGNAAVWLSSDQASYVTGATVGVDGGLILPGMPETINDDGNAGWGRI